VMISQTTPLTNKSISVLVHSLIGLICLYVVARALISTRRFLPSRSYWIAGTVLFTIYLIRFYIDVWVDGIRYIDPVIGTLYLIGNVLLPCIAFCCIWMMPKDHRCLKFTFYFTLIVCFYHLLSGYSAIESGEVFQGRVGSENLNAISLSVLGVQVAMLSVFIRFTGIRRRFLIFTPEIGFLVGIVSAVSGGSRGPILSMLVALALYSFTIKGGKQKVVLLLAIPITLSFIYFIALFMTSDAIGLASFDRFTRMFDDSSYGNQSVSYRVAYFSTGIENWMENPFFGAVIFDRFLGTYYHNTYLEILAGTGLFGFCGLLVLILHSVKGCIRVLKFRPSDAWLVLLFVQSSVMAASSGTLYGQGVMMAFMSLLAVYSLAPRQKFPLMNA